MMRIESQLRDAIYGSDFWSYTTALIFTIKRHLYAPLECPIESNWTDKDGLVKGLFDP